MGALLLFCAVSTAWILLPFHCKGFGNGGSAVLIDRGGGTAYRRRLEIVAVSVSSELRRGGCVCCV